MIVYVKRNGGNKVVGVFRVLQPGIAEEAIDDQHADVVAYFNPDQTAAAQSRIDDVMAQPNDVLKAVALVFLDEINALRTQAGLGTRTPAQLKAAIKAKL